MNSIRLENPPASNFDEGETLHADCLWAGYRFFFGSASKQSTGTHLSAVLKPQNSSFSPLGNKLVRY